MQRRGMSILEVITAGVLLAAVMGVSVQMLAAVAAQRRAAWQRQVAVQEASNLMERLSARPWDELTAESAGDVPISDWARESLPAGVVEIDVAAAPDEPGAKRITVIVRWQNRGSQPPSAARLVAWRYRR